MAIYARCRSKFFPSKFEQIFDNDSLIIRTNIRKSNPQHLVDKAPLVPM